MANYYSDKTLGDDSGTGEIGDPWEYCPGMSDWTGSHTPIADDIFNLKCGEEWRDIITVGWSGSDGSPITFSDYGSGNDPIIYGSNLVETWTQDSGDRWYATLTSTPTVIFKDGLRMDLNPESQASDVDAAEEWYYDSGADRLYVYSDGDPDTVPHVIEASVRDQCIVGEYIDYITIENLELLYAEAQGVKISESDNWIVQDCHVHNHGYIEYNLAHNIYLENADNCLIRRNESHDAGQHGIYIYSGDDNILEYNEVYNNHHSNIDVQRYTSNTTDGVIVRYNLMYYLDGYYGTGNSVNFFSCGGGSTQKVTNLQIYYNIMYTDDADQRHSGIHIWQYVDGPVIYNNIYYNTANAQDGTFCLLENGTLPATVKNNIGQGGSAYPIFRIEDKANKIVDYNCWDVTGGNLTQVDSEGAPGPGYSEAEWTDYQALGFDVNGMNADPLFVDAENYDFHLQTGSPCIDMGVDVSLTQDYEGTSVPLGGGVDIGAYEAMLNKLYGKGREAFLGGDIDWASDTIKAVLVDSADYALDLAAHDFLDDIPAAGQVAISDALAGKSITLGVADANDLTITTVSGDKFEYVVLFKDTGDSATSNLIVCIEGALGLPFTPGGGNVTLKWSNGTNKIFKL